MIIKKISLTFLQIVLLAGTLTASSISQSPPNISVNGSLAPAKARRGRLVSATVVMDIPHGYHVNSNKPLEKFLIPTQLQIEAPKGIVVGVVQYPRAVVRNFKFSKNKVAVYEGRATMRFNVRVPSSFSGDGADLKGKLRYQSCNDDVCFPPETREVSLRLEIS